MLLEFGEFGGEVGGVGVLLGEELFLAEVLGDEVDAGGRLLDLGEDLGGGYRLELVEAHVE